MNRFVLALALTLTACGGARTPPDLYVLQATDPAFTCNRTSDALVIAPVTARQELSGKRIPILLPGSQLTYYTGAAWASAFPEQLRDFMLDRFSSANAFSSVSEEMEISHPLHIVMAIHNAEVEQVEHPQVHLRISGYTVKGTTRLSSFQVNETVIARENRMKDIIAAYQQAADQATYKIAKSMKLKCKIPS